LPRAALLIDLAWSAHGIADIVAHQSSASSLATTSAVLITTTAAEARMSGLGGERTLALDDGFAYEATFPKEEPTCRSHNWDSFLM
jgi:hypothetical protein